MAAGLSRHIVMLSLGAAILSPVQGYAAVPGKELLTPDFIASIRDFVDQDIVRLSILNQNEKYKDVTPNDITRLDAQWVEEREADSKPLISATLSNPLSAYLTRIQAHSKGLYTEIFVMDKNGLNVGQSNISSDYWQGDEAKFQKTYPVGGDAIFIDEPEYNDETATWNAQVNVAVSDGTDPAAIGAVTIEVNLTELQRLNSAAGSTVSITDVQEEVVPVIEDVTTEPDVQNTSPAIAE